MKNINGENTMEKLIGNAVVGQSGGPTSAINATLAGVISGLQKAAALGTVNTIYGMKNGITGLMNERFIDLSAMPEDALCSLSLTPAAALGSCRKKLPEPSEDPAFFESLYAVFKKYDIRYFFYIGGNDSMDTVKKLSEYAKISGETYEMRFIGVPKTIDNDLLLTDHTPGYGSAAKYIATSVKEVLFDIAVYDVPAVTIVEIMGRDAGWLTMAAALPRLSGGREPNLVYLPERTFSVEEFIEDVRAELSKNPAVLVAVSEGIRLADGEYVGAMAQSGATDVFGHKYLAGTARTLERIVKEKIGCKVRSMELNLLQRCGAHLASATDIAESRGVGKFAVSAALSGESGVMAAFRRNDGEVYSVGYVTYPVNNVANGVKTVPDAFINERGNGITDAGLRYIAPLITGETDLHFENGMPDYFSFENN